MNLNINERLSKIGTDLYSCFDRATDKISKSKRINLVLIAVICVASFSMVLFLNSMSHLAADDFAYNFVFIEDASDTSGGFVTGKRLESFSDVFTSMKAHYNTVNGRVLLHFIVQVMMLLGRPVFNVFNSVMFVLLIFLIYLHCKGRNKNHSAAVFCMSALAVWTFVPGAGVTLFWLDGSVNYLWGSVIRLAALLPLRYYADSGETKRGAPMAVFMALLSFAAGATNENMSAAYIGMVFLFILLYKFRGYKIRLWHIVTLVASVAGFLFMILAPGTGMRMEVWGNEPLWKMAALIFYKMTEKLLPFILVSSVLAIVLKRMKNTLKADFAVAAVYLAGSVAGAAVMAVSSYFPERAWFGSIMLGISGCGILVYQLGVNSSTVRKCMVVATLFWSVWGIASLCANAYDAFVIDSQFDAREAYIAEQKEQGNYDLTLRLIAPDKKRSPHYGVADISKDAENRRNKDMAKYYGLNSVVIGENDEY